MIYLIAVFAIIILFSMLLSEPSVNITSEGFVEYVVYGPGPWWYLGGPGPRGFGGGPYPRRRWWTRRHYCPYRRMWVY